MVNITYILSKITKIIVAFILIIIIILISRVIRKNLLKRAKTKKMKHNAIMFSSLFNYVAIFLVIFFTVLSFTGTTTVGITAGLLTAALGWALQRPITGIAGWLMIIITEPFKIGDRIIIGGVKGDVINITLTHIHLHEFGGTASGEDPSGRIILVPNSIIFEQNIINYTSTDEFVLDEVVFTVTYDSNIDMAREISIKAAEKITQNILDKVPAKPTVRINFQPSGIDIRVRYYVQASKRTKINSEITEEIFKQISKNEKVKFAYPHTYVILDKKEK